MAEAKQLTLWQETHRDLVKRAEAWLRANGFPLAWGEVKCWAAGEQPDAIGWNYMGNSCVIEVKVSRSDFFADRKKPFRQEGKGCGRLRYFLTPAGLVKPDDLPQGWGLLQPSGRGLRKIVRSATFTPNREDEIALLVTCARHRLAETANQGHP